MSKTRKSIIETMFNVSISLNLISLDGGTWDTSRDTKWPFLPVPGQKVSVGVGPGHVRIKDVILHIDSPDIDVVLEDVQEEVPGEHADWIKYLEVHGWD